MIRHPLLYLLTGLTLFAAGGASCPWLRRQITEPAPAAFTGPPTLDALIYAVNSNSAPIRQLQTESAKLSVPGLPALQANLALERPRRFRLRAELMGLIGPEMDLGSNDDMFWIWVKRNTPPAVFYARHDQFQHSPMRELLPIEPHWLIEALGVVHLDPAGKYEGPFPREAGRVEIHSRIPTPDGEMTKSIVVHETYGWVLEQHVYDVRGQLVASVRASRHRYYPLEAVSLPHRVEIQIPRAQMAFQINVESYLINQLYADPVQLWAPPQSKEYPKIDIGDPRLRFPAPPSQAGPPHYGAPVENGSAYVHPRTGYRPRYRGFTAPRQR